MGSGALCSARAWPGRELAPSLFGKISSRDLLNFDISYRSPDERWTLGIYGRNVTDERYVNAKLNVTDYILSILSNDASEFGVRYVNNF